LTNSTDRWPVQTAWRFDTLSGSADDTAYLSDICVVPPTYGDHGCRDYCIGLGFIPDSHYVFPAGGGEHTIQVTTRDYAGTWVSQSHTYTVITPNQAPTAVSQSVSTVEDIPLDIVLTGSDPNCDPPTYSVMSCPSHGILSGIAPNLTDSPAPGYGEPDSLTFIVNDSELDAEMAVVSITVKFVTCLPLTVT
jgi:Bacterial Ig domain